jgi:hypothetical protein
VLLVLAGGRPAVAAPDAARDTAATKAAAEAKLIEGVERLKVHDDRGALERFQEAYALVPSPLIFYDFGLAQLGLGDEPRALESFERFLAEAPDAPPDKRRKAELHRDELSARVSVVTLAANVDVADLTVDGLGLGRVSFPRRLYLGPGAHQVFARAGGAVQAATVTCVAGQKIGLALRLAPPPTSVVEAARNEPVAWPGAATPAEPPAAKGVELLAASSSSSPSSARSVQTIQPWALSLAAAGAVSLGVGLTFGLLARNNGNEVTGDSRNGLTFVPAEEAAGLRDQRLEVVFLSVGAVAVAAGVGLYAWARHGAHSHGGPATEGPP